MALEWHRSLESRSFTFSVLTAIAVAVGGLALLVPPYFLQGTIVPVDGIEPYSALELEGRDLYIREGCNNCHSQQVRPFKTETDRYGSYSLAGESIYDRPFLWGSRRTGPDLHRIGGRYPDSWHWIHFMNPRNVEPRSNMPGFAFLAEAELDLSSTPRKLEVLRSLGHPYTDAQIEGAAGDAHAAMDAIAASLRADGVEVSERGTRSEMIALIAYLQSLGKAVQAKAVERVALGEDRR
jgi:cytochrome c oxidase cbb3-type subunit I/II